jgi:hypothetical protein
MRSQDKKATRDADQATTMDLTNSRFSPDGERQGRAALADDVLATLAGGLASPGIANLDGFDGC